MTQFDDVLIYTHGRHIIKTGYQMNRYNINVFYSGNAGELGALLYRERPRWQLFRERHTGTATRLPIGLWVFRRT